MYTAQSLKQQYKTLAAAKTQLNLKARGWQALADKLNQPSPEDAIAQLEQLRLENAALKQQLDQPQRHRSRSRSNGLREAGSDLPVPRMGELRGRSWLD